MRRRHPRYGARVARDSGVTVGDILGEHWAIRAGDGQAIFLPSMTWLS